MCYVLGKERCSRAKVETGRTVCGPSEMMNHDASSGWTGKKWKTWRDIFESRDCGSCWSRRCVERETKDHGPCLGLRFTHRWEGSWATELPPGGGGKGWMIRSVWDLQGEQPKAHEREGWRHGRLQHPDAECAYCQVLGLGWKVTFMCVSHSLLWAFRCLTNILDFWGAVGKTLPWRHLWLSRNVSVGRFHTSRQLSFP